MRHALNVDKKLKSHFSHQVIVRCIAKTASVPEKGDEEATTAVLVKCTTSLAALAAILPKCHFVRQAIVPCIVGTALRSNEANKSFTLLSTSPVFTGLVALR